jgi:hypothetical protein
MTCDGRKDAPMSEKLSRPIPPIDADAPSQTASATFASG